MTEVIDAIAAGLTIVFIVYGLRVEREMKKQEKHHDD